MAVGGFSLARVRLLELVVSQNGQQNQLFIPLPLDAPVLICQKPALFCQIPTHIGRIAAAVCGLGWWRNSATPGMAPTIAP